MISDSDHSIQAPHSALVNKGTVLRTRSALWIGCLAAERIDSKVPILGIAGQNACQLA